MGRRPATVAAVLAFLVLGGCTESVRVSRGNRIPQELQGASSAQVVEHFTLLERGIELSVVGTFVDFAYVRALTRERSRTEETEREAYRRYVRRQASFYVYLTLHRMESCRTHSSGRDDDEDDDEDREDVADDADRLDLRSWDFVLRTDRGRDREPERFEPGPTQLAPGGGCLVQGYVHFRGNLPADATWMELVVSDGEGRDAVESTLRWALSPWEPPPRRRRPRSERPRREERERLPRREAPPAEEPTPAPPPPPAAEPEGPSAASLADSVPPPPPGAEEAPPTSPPLPSPEPGE